MGPELKVILIILIIVLIILLFYMWYKYTHGNNNGTNDNNSDNTNNNGNNNGTNGNNSDNTNNNGNNNTNTNNNNGSIFDNDPNNNGIIFNNDNNSNNNTNNNNVNNNESIFGNDTNNADNLNNNDGLIFGKAEPVKNYQFISENIIIGNHNNIPIDYAFQGAYQANQPHFVYKIEAQLNPYYKLNSSLIANTQILDLGNHIADSSGYIKFSRSINVLTSEMKNALDNGQAYIKLKIVGLDGEALLPVQMA